MAWKFAKSGLGSVLSIAAAAIATAAAVFCLREAARKEDKTKIARILFA